MSDHLLRTLQYLRVYGPCSIRTLTIQMYGRGRRRQANRKQVYMACYDLIVRGLVSHVGEALWDVSEAGRALLVTRGKQAEFFDQEARQQ